MKDTIYVHDFMNKKELRNSEKNVMDIHESII